MASFESASGPITATFFRFCESGRSWPSFRGQPRFLFVLGQCEHLRQLRLVRVRLLEEPHAYLDGENGPHGFFDIVQLQGAVRHESGQVLRVCTAGHIHVQPCTQCAQGRIPPIPREALDDEVSDRHRIADNEALEAPLASQYIVQEEAVPAGTPAFTAAWKGGK